MIALNTSLRTRPIRETLRHAEAYAKRLGITRVTDTTRLDRAGIPVCASIRPKALSGSLCVTAGKGVTRMEARVGAFMEAIEYAMAEPKRSSFSIESKQAREILDGEIRQGAILDLCPRLGSSINPESLMEAIQLPDLISGKSFWVPAALVFLPYIAPKGFEYPFVSSSVGLASGNSIDEASIHALLEVIEHDITAFNHVCDQSEWVTNLPGKISRIKTQVEKTGLQLGLRYVPNTFDIPFFAAFVADPGLADPLFVNSGFGCHFHLETAALRAVTEALQSRLTMIHGSRDDLITEAAAYEGLGPEVLAAAFKHRMGTVFNMRGSRTFLSIKTRKWQADSISGYLDLLLDRLSMLGFNHVLRAAFSNSNEPLQVVRTIVPRMERFGGMDAVGPRISAYAERYTSGALRGPEHQ